MNEALIETKTQEQADREAVTATRKKLRVQSLIYPETEDLADALENLQWAGKHGLAALIAYAVMAHEQGNGDEALDYIRDLAIDARGRA